MNEILRDLSLFAAAGCALIIVGFVSVAYRRKGKTPQRLKVLTVEKDYVSTNALMKQALKEKSA